MGGILFQTIIDIAFRYDGERVALALERTGYDLSLVIVILNKDGSLFGSFREMTSVS